MLERVAITAELRLARKSDKAKAACGIPGRRLRGTQEIAQSLASDAELFLEGCGLTKQQVTINGFRVLCSDDEEVFRCMFQGDKLLNPGDVSAGIQVHASERVGNGFCHSVSLYSMHEQRCEGRRRGQLWPQLLVAARCHKDQLGVSRNRSIKSVIGRCIAGV